MLPRLFADDVFVIYYLAAYFALANSYSRCLHCHNRVEQSETTVIFFLFDVWKLICACVLYEKTIRPKYLINCLQYFRVCMCVFAICLLLLSWPCMSAVFLLLTCYPATLVFQLLCYKVNNSFCIIAIRMVHHEIYDMHFDLEISGWKLWMLLAKFDRMIVTLLLQLLVNLYCY